MKTTIKMTILATLLTSASVSAVQFNTSVLKDMQDKGMELANQAENLKLLATDKNKCLQIAGSTAKAGQGVSLAVCKDTINQKWRSDKLGHLINAGGQCLAYLGDTKAPGGILKTAECNNEAANQKWQFDDAGRLVNAGNLCMDGTGTRVTSTACSEAAFQQWKFNSTTTE